MIGITFYIGEKINEVSQENPVYSGGKALYKFKVLVFMMVFNQWCFKA